MQKEAHTFTVVLIGKIETIFGTKGESNPECPTDLSIFQSRQVYVLTEPTSFKTRGEIASINVIVIRVSYIHREIIMAI